MRSLKSKLRTEKAKKLFSMLSSSESFASHTVSSRVSRWRRGTFSSSNEEPLTTQMKNEAVDLGSVHS